MGKVIITIIFMLALLTVFEETSYGSSENCYKGTIINGLQLIVRLDCAVKSVNEPFWIRLEVCNLSNEEKTLHLRHHAKDFHFEINRISIKGTPPKPVFMTAHGSHLNDELQCGSVSSKKYPPGKSYSVRMNLSRFYDLSWTGNYYLTAIYTIKTGKREWKDLIVENVKFTLRSTVKNTKQVDENEERESVVSNDEPEKQAPEIPNDEKPEKIEKMEEPVEEAFPWFLVAIIEAVIIGALMVIIILRSRK